jgi:hypothetical protein
MPASRLSISPRGRMFPKRGNVSASRVRFGERLVLVIIFSASVLAYAGAILLVALRKTNQRLDVSTRPIVRWMPERQTPAVTEPRYVIADLFDPSLVSLPNAHGFSRQLWTREIPVAPRSTEWNLEPSYLDWTAPRTFDTLLEQEPLLEAVQSSVEKPPTEPELIPDGSLPQAVTPQNISVIKTGGGISRRSIVSQPALSTISATAPLRPTRLLVAVASDGTIRYSELERSCGDEAVDARALDLTREIRFNVQLTSDMGALDWGTLRFLWAVVPQSQ